MHIGSSKQLASHVTAAVEHSFITLPLTNTWYYNHNIPVNTALFDSPNAGTLAPKGSPLKPYLIYKTWKF